MDFDDDILQPLYNLLLNHPLVQEHLSGENIRLDGTDLEPEDLLVFDDLPDMKAVEFAQLFSIFNGSRVHQQLQNTEGPDSAPPGMYFTIVNPALIQHPHKNRFGLIRRENGTELFISDLFIDHYFLTTQAPELLGTIAITLSAITAYRARLQRIELVAAGGRGYSAQFVGYRVWPKFGFDAPLEPEDLTNAPQLTGCTTVQQVLALAPGWWAINGSQRIMTFDLTPGSKSWTKLLSYIGSKLTPEVPQ